MKLPRSMISSFVLLVGLGYLGFCLLIFVVQDSLIFFPSNSLTSLQRSPADINLVYEDIYLSSTKDRKIHGWFLPHPKPRATLLFLHGNAGNISHRLETLQIFHELNLASFIIDYQGYGLSQGRPSEQNTYDDALAAWNYLTSEKNSAEGSIIIFGRSMGGGVASWLAEQYPPALLILESTFQSIANMGSERYPFLPINILTRTRFDTAARIKNIQAPIAIIHSPEDDIVPYSHAEALFQKAAEPKLFLPITGNHNTGFLHPDSAYENLLNELIYKYIVN